MGEKKLKRYGRTKLNRLDWLLAITCCVFSLAALWISLGISMANAAPDALEAFKTFVRGLYFNFDTVMFGQSTIISVFVSVLVYESLLTLIVGSIYFSKKKIKGRIPGLWSLFFASTGFALYLCFVYEFASGNAKDVINVFWPYSLIFFLVVFGCLVITASVLTLNQNSKIEYAEEEVEEGKVVEETAEEIIEEAVIEEVIEEEPSIEEAEESTDEEVVEEAATEETVEEAEPEETIEEEVEEEEESDGEEESFIEDEEEPENPFANLGKRRKRIPFENKIKRAKPEIRTRYRLIVSALREYAFNDRKSVPCETFSYKKEKMIILTFSGQTLKVYFRLNPKDYIDSPIPVKDAEGIKKYEETPAFLIIKSDLAARRVVQLAERIVEEHNIPKK